MAKSTTQPDSTDTSAVVSDTQTQTKEAEVSKTEVPAETAAAAEDQDLESFDQNRFLVNMVSDPEIQEILAARRDGRDVRVVSEDKKPPAVAPEPVAEEILGEEIDDDTKKLINLFDKKISSKLDPLIEKVGNLEHLAQGMEKKAFSDQIAQISSKHPDFNKYRKQMAKLARAEGAGLGVEELFILSKHRAGELNVTEPSTHSEKPTPTPRRRSPHNKDIEEGRPVSRRKRFQVTLADALDNLENLPG